LRSCAIVLLLILIFITNPSYGQKFIVDTTKGNEIRFFAEATLNNFEGFTKSVHGYITLNDKNNQFDFIVMLDSLDTGIGLRNKHMRNDLHTKKYPAAEFKGSSLTIDSISVSEFDLKVPGNFTVNGVTKSLVAKGIFYNFGELKKIISNFELKLSDFNIERPSFLFNKLDNLIKLRVILYLTREN
jgi:polyisoprenoid-binding protein YceI